MLPAPSSTCKPFLVQLGVPTLPVRIANAMTEP
jgi:hypothetical protein